MTKELQAFKDISQLISTIEFGGRKDKAVVEDELNTIETALKNYEEGLSNAKTYVKHTSKQALYDLLGLALKNVHRSFWKLPEQLYDDVNKSLKALEIIRTKEIDIRLFNDCPGLDEYNNWASDESQLTKEQYDLLKEALL